MILHAFDRYLPWIAVLLAAAAGFAADRAAAARRPDGDRGDFWAAVTARSCVLLALPVLLSGALRTLFPQYWQTGRHLQLDLTTTAQLPLSTCYRIALLLPFVVWSALLALGLMRRPRGREAGRWLAGAIGFGRHRAWVLWCALPLAAIDVWTRPQLGGGATAYPAAAWSSLAVIALSLVGVAFSAGATAGATAAGAIVGAGHALRPWPEALAARGLQLRHLASWPASAAAREVRPAASGLAARLRAMGAQGVAPELVETVSELVAAEANTIEHGMTRIAFAPDDCGQVESVAMAALLLHQQLHATTLVVTAGGADELAARLDAWLPEGVRASVVEQDGELPTDALVWVITAQVLSDRLLPMLRDPAVIKRFGLVVWWHLHAFTGVLAANLWAISRRLHRLLRARGRRDVRTLALVRSVAHGGAQLAAFVRRLLPHPFPTSSEVHVEQRFPRPIELHLLESHEAYFASGEGRNVQERLRHLSLVAAKASVEERWPTHLEIPEEVAEPEAAAFLQLPAGGAVIRDQLVADSATAGARLMEVRTGDVLSLVEIIGQGGRAASPGLIHHVGVAPPVNPYVAHMLTTLAGREAAPFTTSRRLVAAEALSGVIRRHLMLALNELPDTRHGLLKDFLWNEDAIRSTLEAIYREGKLTRVEVRSLGEGDRLRIDNEYTSQRLPSGEQRPLDTVGTSLVEVRDPSAGHDVDGGVRMRVDPERLTIQAYPHRVFQHRGRRYRIRAWESLDEVVNSRWLACDRDDVLSHTWRLRNILLFGIAPSQAPVGIGRSGKLLSRFAADVHYEEWVQGVLRWSPDLTTRRATRPVTQRLARPVSQSFATRALILRFPDAEEPVALASLAQALRHVLPVHLGVEEDALEVVPLDGDLLGGIATFGLAIVDLYPGGIGLVDEVGDDSPFLLQLLHWTRDWLVACPCRSDQGCERCLRSPAALAVNSDQPPLRSAALSLLGQVV